MNTKQSIMIIFQAGILFLFGISIAACEVGQPPAPTVTPVPTDTPFSTATSTVTPTLTPTLQPKDGEKLIMEIDPQTDLETLTANLIISPDLQHAAYIVQEKELYVPVVDGQRWQPIENGHPPVFSPTSQQLALANFRDGQRRMVINGEEGPAYDGMGRPVFSPDGQRLAYSVKQDDQWFVVVDGQERGPYQAIMTGDLVQGKPLILMDVSPIVFSPDSQRIAFVAQKGNQWFLIIDGVETLLPYDGVVLSSLTFSPDGQQFAYIAEDKGKRFLVINGEEQTAYNQIAYFDFSPDSQHTAYAAKKGGAMGRRGRWQGRPCL